MTEADLMREVMIALSSLGHRVFRNNIGACRDERGNYIRYGVCNPGGADLVGWMGDGSGRILAVEIKSGKGKLTKDQELFLAAVNKAGGVGVWGKSVQEILNALPI